MRDARVRPPHKPFGKPAGTQDDVLNETVDSLSGDPRSISVSRAKFDRFLCAFIARGASDPVQETFEYLALLEGYEAQIIDRRERGDGVHQRSVPVEGFQVGITNDEAWLERFTARAPKS